MIRKTIEFLVLCGALYYGYEDNVLLAEILEAAENVNHLESNVEFPSEIKFESEGIKKNGS